MNHFAAIVQKLSEHDLDAIWITGAANRFYASGFRTSEGDGAVLITPEKTWYFTDGRYIEAAGHLVQHAEIRKVTAKHDYKEQAAELIRTHKIQRLGFEEANITLKSYEKYQDAFSCKMLPASDILAELRMTKEPEEITAIRDAQHITELAFQQVLEEIRPGVSEKELAARLQYLMLHYGAEDMAFDPIVVSGVNGSLPHGVPSEKEIQNGDFVTMDIGCIRHGYCSDMTRTVAVGHVSDQMREVYQTVLAAQMAGIQAAAAGVTGKDVDQAARNVIDATTYKDLFSHSFGHGVGIEVHEAPNASSLNDKPLPAGAVISAEPGIYIPGVMGVRIEDMLWITEEGNQNLTGIKKELLIL